MGCGKSSEYKKRVRADITTKFDTFDFRINPTDLFTLTQRAKRELTGGCAPDDYMAKIFNGYREFMIESAVEIVLSNRKPEKGRFVAVNTPAPLIDELWCLSILYTQKYKELCELLVGAVIDRVPSKRLNGYKLIKNIWPDYQQGFWNLDQNYVVWILNKDVNYFLNYFYDKIKEGARDNKIHVHKKAVKSELDKLHSYLEFKYTSVDIRKIPCQIPPSHTFYNPEKSTANPFDIYNQIFRSLPSTLGDQIKQKYSVGDKSLFYLQEYARFLTLIYFSKFTLTPSEEVDQVWHLHQSLTVAYREFCLRTFGRMIDHNPTVGGQEDTEKYSYYYTSTVEFYKFLFKESPPVGLWPPVDYRFNPENFVGCWYSLLRVYQCVLRVIDMHRNTRPADVPTEVMGCYFSWTGKNLFHKTTYKINLMQPAQRRVGCGMNNYWYVGGCAII